MALPLLLLLTLAGAGSAANAEPTGECRHAAFARMADGDWRTIRTARDPGGALITTDRPFKARVPQPGIIELAGPDGTMFLRMTRTDTGYRYEEPGAGDTLAGGETRVVSCGVPDARGYQTIVEIGVEAGAPGQVEDTLTVVVAGPDVVTMTGSLRPHGSREPHRWATTMTMLRTR